MSSNNYTQPILNPIVYLNYLSPAVANEYEIARDVFLVTFGALLWDILSTLSDDWKLLRTCKFTPVLVAYFLSRTCALLVVLMSALAKTGPVQNCGVVELVLWVFWVFASVSSSYLFLKRVHAVYFQERVVRHAFTLLWMAGVGVSTLVLSANPLHDYYQIADTKHCMNVKVESYVSIAFIVPVLFDALVYSAISYKILKSHRRTTERTGWKAFWCFNRALPHLSRAILQGGQQYYLFTNGANISCLVLAQSPNASPVLQLLVSVPAITLTSAMACRVFRNLKLEAMQDVETGNLTTIQFVAKEPPKHATLALAV